MVTVARRPVCPVTLTPGDPALASVRDLVDAWSAHDALAELVTMFGGAFPQTDHLEARLASLDKFSTAWDYRARARAARALHGEPVRCQDSGGGARWLIPRLDLPAKKRDAIVGLAQQLGLTLESTPQGTTFDHVLVIGTGRHSNLIRARWPGNWQRVARLVTSCSPPHRVDCCPPRMTRSRYVRQRDDNPHRDSMVWRFAADTNDLGVPITLLEAPSPEPDSSRATSADTFTFTAHTLGMQDSTCLLVTGQPFVPYQNFDALRTLALPFGIQVETVGFGIDRYDGLGELDQQHPAKLLQEVRSTIRAARALLERIEAGERMATDPRR